MSSLADVAVLRSVIHREGSGRRQETDEAEHGSMFLQLEVQEAEISAQDDGPARLLVGMRVSATHARGVVTADSLATYEVPRKHQELAANREAVVDFATKHVARALHPHNRALLSTLGSLILNARVFLPDLPENLSFSIDELEDSGEETQD